MKYYVYILFSSKLSSIYIGFTTDLIKRLKGHNNGKTKSTRYGSPWKVIYYQVFLSENDARREEIFLKSGQGRERIKILLKETLKYIKT